MRDLQINCLFLQCPDVSAARIEECAAVALAQGFEFTRSVGVKKSAVVRERVGLSELIEAHRVVLATDRKQLPKRWRVGFPCRPTSQPDLIGSFECFQFAPNRNRFSLYALIDFEVRDQRGLVRPYEERIVRVAHALYPLVSANLGFVDATNREHTTVVDAAKLRLSGIGWLNFWSPAYVERYGKSFLLKMPGTHTEELPDGGVFHQLSPWLVTDDKAAATLARKRVVEYCAEHGHKVKCYAPYFLKGV